MKYIHGTKNYSAIMRKAFAYYTKAEGYSAEEAREFCRNLCNEKVKDVADILRDYVGIEPIM